MGAAHYHRVVVWLRNQCQPPSRDKTGSDRTAQKADAHRPPGRGAAGGLKQKGWWRQAFIDLLLLLHLTVMNEWRISHQPARGCGWTLLSSGLYHYSLHHHLLLLYVL